MDKKTKHRKINRKDRSNMQRTHLVLPASFLRDAADPVMYEVNGNGMAGAGILDMDQIILDRNRVPKSSDIVIITTGGSTVLRRIFFENDNVRIRREDGITKDVVTSDYRIEGVMTGLIRTNRREPHEQI